MFQSYTAFICPSYRPQWVYTTKLAEAGGWQLRRTAKGNMRVKTTMSFIKVMAIFFCFPIWELNILLLIILKMNDLYCSYFVQYHPLKSVLCHADVCPHTFVHKSVTKFSLQVHTILNSIRVTADLSYSARLYFVQEGNMSLLLRTSFVFPLCFLLD